MEEFMTSDELISKIKKRPDLPYIIIDFMVLNENEIDLWCTQHESAVFVMGDPSFRLVRGKIAYDVPRMKEIGRKIKKIMSKKLCAYGYEIHSNLRFRE